MGLFGSVVEFNQDHGRSVDFAAFPGCGLYAEIFA
jgi:hypothetical protein